MKLAQILLALVLLSSFVLFTSDVQAITTLSKGVTLGDWLSPDEAYYIQTTRYTKADFENIQALGCDFVRITVNFNTSGMSPDGVISPIQTKCLDNAVMWAQEVGLKVVIANAGGAISDATAVATAERVAGNWKDVAGHFASKGDDLVLYEIFVSPGNLITAEAWNTAANTIIAALRQVDAKHTIIVGPVNWYSIDELANLEKFADANVLYAFEMNDPVLFTRQGSTFHEVVYNTVTVPFPYSAGRMPAMAAGDPESEAAATAAYDNYPTQGTVDWVKARVDAAAQTADGKGMTLWCSSMGVNAGAQWYNGALGYDIPVADRAAWYEAARTEMEAKAIGWTLTNYIGNHSVFENYGNGTANFMMFSNFPYDVNATIATALGLVAPSPSLYVPTPLTEGIVLFDEEINPMVRLGFWLGDGEPDFFVTDSPVSGKYCMAIRFPGQWNAVDFFFPLYQDMSELAANGYVLDLFIRCDNDAAHIEPRFEMTNEYEEDRPWRMNYHLDNTVVPFDGDWQRFTMPLTEMQDQGAWDPDDQLWYGGPGGLIDWARVQRLQFVSETAAQPDAEIYIDRVRIVDPATLVREQGGVVPGEFNLSANYPNPFNPSTTINYTLSAGGAVTLAVYNVRGELIKTIVSGVQAAGEYSVQWDGTNLPGVAAPSGVYLYRLTSDKQEITRRMVLIR